MRKTLESKEKERPSSDNPFIIDGFLRRLFLLQPSFIRESNRAEQIKMVRAHGSLYTCLYPGVIHTSKWLQRRPTLLHNNDNKIYVYIVCI